MRATIVAAVKENVSSAAIHIQVQQISVNPNNTSPAIENTKAVGYSVSTANS